MQNYQLHDINQLKTHKKKKHVKTLPQHKIITSLIEEDDAN